MSLYEDYKKKEKENRYTNPENTNPLIKTSLYDRFKANSKTPTVPINPVPEPKKDIFQKYMDISQKGQDLSEEFYLGVVGGVSKLFQQALAVGSQTLSGNYRFTKYNAKILSMLGVPDEKNYYLNNPTKVSDIEQRIADKLEKTRTTLKANTDTNIAYLQSLNPMHDTLAGQVAGGVGSTAVFAGAGIAKVPATLLAISEAAMNAEDAYDTNIENGMNKKEAMKRSMAQFTADSIIGAITNNIGFLGKLSGGKNLINIGNSTLGKVLSASLEILKDTSIETLQEVSQTGTANLATGRPFTEGMSQTALVAFLSSLPFGGFATLTNVNELPVEERKQVISNEIERIKQKVESGQKLTPDESVIYVTVAGVNPLKGEIAEKQIDDNLMKQILQDSMIEKPKTQEEADFIKQEKERISKLNDKEKEDEALFQKKEEEKEMTKILRGTKGLTADDIMKTHPNIQLTKDVPAKDVYGNKVIIPDGEKLTPYEMKDGKILLQDGETYLVSKNQFQNIKGNTIGGEAKPFAPELGGLEETVKGASKWKGDELYDNGNRLADVYEQDGKWHYRSDMVEESPAFKTRKEAMENAEADTLGIYSGNETKYSQYQLPGGKNYREVLIRAPENKIPENYSKFTFKSSHWDEPNVISHLRMNDRTYKGKKVAFMEELQSDWAREAREKGTINPDIKEPTLPDGWKIIDNGDTYQVVNRQGVPVPDKLYGTTGAYGGNRDIAIAKATGDDAFLKSKESGIPNNPNLKKWQELAIKEALIKAVENNADYLAWINGEQTSARYNLATKVKEVVWKPDKTGTKHIMLDPVSNDGGRLVTFNVDKNGLVSETSKSIPVDWRGKKLDEVLGKGLADKIMEKESGTLSGEGLKFGGEWASNLYDKQVPNIVKDLTGAKIETLDMDTGKQQAIKLTPEIKAKIQGKSPNIKTSGRMFETQEEAFYSKKTQSDTISYQRGLEIIKDFQKRLGIDFPVYVYSKILTGETLKDGSLGEAYGMYLNGAITLSEFIKETTAYHEIGHLLFRNMENIPVFKGLTRDKIYSELRNKYGNLSKNDLEERLMEEVEKRASEIAEGKNPKTPTTFIGRLVEKIYNFFKDLFGLSPQEYRSIEKFLDRMYFGKNTEVVTLHDSGATSAFMKKRMEEFGEDIPMFEKKEETERNYPSRQEVINEINKQPKDTPAKAFVKGKKAGKIIFENKQETKDRKSELNRMRESITTRLYRLSLIDTLRKNLPRSEWGKYLKRLTEVGISESKYLNLTRVIKDASVDIMVENGDRKDRATMRSKIGYLRNVFDINPKLILSIKNYLDIRDVYQSGDKKGQKKETLKSIKDYDFAELLRFEAELQKRIEYRKNNPVSYFDYLEEPKNNVLDNIKKVSSMAIDTIERRLRNISPVLEQVFMTHYFEIDKQTNNRLDKIKSFVDAYLKAPEETQILIQKDAQNGRVEALEATLQAIGVDAKSIEETREVLDEIYEELKNVGLDIGYVKNYFPRRLKPMTPDMANLAIKIFENSQGMPATQEEKVQLTSNLLRGLSTTRLPFITLSGQKFATERLVEEITDSNIGFYEDLATSLIDYIKGATQTIEQRKFFGKNFVETLDDEASLNNSIAKYVVDMVDSGQIKSKDINELRDILRTVFKPMETNLLTKFTNDYVYPIALNQFTSTLNQAKDLSLQILKDVLVGQFNLIGSQQLKPSDIFTEQSFLDLEKAIETNDKSAVAKILEKTMIPFSKADLNFLRVYINASYKRVIKLAKRGNQEFQTTLENIFGKDKAQEVIAELKTKNGTEKEISDEIKRILYGEVASIRPITKLQKTELALNEKSRMFYVLKNYMIKQIEFTRKESLDYIAKGIKTNDTKMIAKGVGRLTIILAMVSTLGASIDSLKDWILGKGNEKEFIKDNVVENLFNVIGWNNYSTIMAKREGLPAQIIETYLSPSGLTIPALFANDVWKDLKDLFDGELKTPRTIKKVPIIGNLLYRNL